MPLTLTTHDTGFDTPDDATIAKVLASMDGVHNVLVTLAHSDHMFLQASGSARAGFTVAYQDGSIDRYYRSKNTALPLDWVTRAFQQYAREDLSWRQGVEWVKEEVTSPRAAFLGSWISFVLLLLAGAVLVWWLRG